MTNPGQGLNGGDPLRAGFPSIVEFALLAQIGFTVFVRHRKTVSNFSISLLIPRTSPRQRGCVNTFCSSFASAFRVPVKQLVYCEYMLHGFASSKGTVLLICSIALGLCLLSLRKFVLLNSALVVAECCLAHKFSVMNLF